MLIVVGQDQFIIEHIHGVYKCINQAFLKITVCWIAMTELLKPCRHLLAGQLWLLPFRSLDIHKDFFLCPLDVRHETERGRCDRKHHPQRDLTPKPKRRLQLAAAVKMFGKRLKADIFVIFCKINLDKSTAFSRPFGSNLGQVA